MKNSNTIHERAGRLAHCRLALAFLCLAGIAGCGARQEPIEVEKAAAFLRVGRAQEALENLSGIDTPRACWLKSIALERLNQLDDARAQIARALEQQPKNPEFQGMQLRLQLYQAKMEAVDGILKLRDENRTSAALALFAFYAHAARSVHAQVLMKDEEARAEGSKAIDALTSAIALGSDIPEFQRELLSLAVKSNLGQGVDLLSEKLYRYAPDDVSIVNDRLSVLALTGRPDEAVSVAQQLYELKKHDDASAVTFAGVLELSTPSVDHDRMFETLVRETPGQPTLALKYAVYLTRSRRLKEAVATMEETLAKQKDPGMRQAILDALMGLTLEAGDPDVAENRLNRYRGEIADPLLIAYFEGRIRFLRKDYIGALARLSEVVNAQKDAVGTQRPLAAEALAWTQVILADKNAVKVLEHAVRDMRVRAGLPVDDEEPATAEIPESAASSAKRGPGGPKPESPKTEAPRKAP